MLAMGGDSCRDEKETAPRESKSSGEKSRAGGRTGRARSRGIMVREQEV